MTTWISHRGYCRRFTENTLSAFREAVAEGFRHLETDLRLSSDRQVVLFHDEDLVRIAGKKIKISEESLADLQKIKLPCGEKIPRLSDFLTEFGSLRWTLDIKEPGGRQVLQELLQFPVLRQKKDLKFVVWKTEHKNWIKTHFPQAEIYEDLGICRWVGFAAITRLLLLFPLKKGQIYSLPYEWKGFKFFRPELVRQFHKKEAKLLAFLPKGPEQAQAALCAGFDEILSNFPPPT